MCARTQAQRECGDMQYTGTLGITKFSGRGELKFKHLYDIAKRGNARENEKGEKITLNNFHGKQENFLENQD